MEQLTEKTEVQIRNYVIEDGAYVDLEMVVWLFVIN